MLNPWTPPETELIELAKRKNQAAFSALVERYQKKVLGVVMKIVKNEEVAKDLTQDALLSAYKNLDSFETGTNFNAWLMRIATNLSLNYLKSPKSLVAEDASEKGGKVLEMERFRQTPQKELLRKELITKLEKAMAELSEMHREILLLRERDELSYDEISKELNIPVGTVMSRLNHARKFLREELEAYVKGIGLSGLSKIAHSDNDWRVRLFQKITR
mgnify:CR=1 FL=1